MGATHTIAVDEENLLGEINQIHDGLGIDVVVDLSGRNLSLRDAIHIVRPEGQIVRAGWGPGSYNFSLDPLVHKGVTLKGVFSHNWEIWEKSLGLLASGRIDLTDLEVLRLPIDRWQEGFEGMCEARLIKVVIEPNGDIEE